MIEYRIIKSNYKVLPELWKENWQLLVIDNWNMIFSRTIKQTREVTIDKESPEWLEFIKTYRAINNNGSYDKRLIKKYHEVIKETPHIEIMDNLKDYKLHLEVTKKQKFALQVWTYLNKASYKNTWEIVKDVSKKWINDIYKERKLTAPEIDMINTEISAWETKQNQEIRSWVVYNMIKDLINK